MGQWLWDRRYRSVALGQLLWVVTIDRSRLVVIGHSLYIFASC